MRLKLSEKVPPIVTPAPVPLLFHKRFSGTSYQRFKAFSHPSQSAAADELQRLGWRVWEDDVDMDDEIINQARSDCGQEPKDTIFVLITKDGDFTELVEDLKQQARSSHLPCLTAIRA